MAVHTSEMRTVSSCNLDFLLYMSFPEKTRNIENYSTNLAVYL